MSRHPASWIVRCALPTPSDGIASLSHATPNANATRRLHLTISTRRFAVRLVLATCLGVGTSLSALAESPTDALPAVLEQLGAGDAKAGARLEAIVHMAGKPGAESQRRKFAIALSKGLKSDLPLDAKVLICRHLESIGKAKVVIPLGKILRSEDAEPRLRDAARRALEANPTSGAKKELRRAADGSAGDLRAAICAALGRRRDLLALNVLMSATESEEREVRLAAIRALAEIGDEQCVQPIEKALLQSPAEKDLPRLRAAYVQLAYSLADNGDRGMARRIFQRIEPLGDEYRATALRGYAQATLQSEVPKIVAALGDAAPAVRAAAEEAAVAFDAPRMDQQLVTALPASEGETRTRIIRSLAGRASSEALPVLLEIAREAGPAADRALAIGGLGKSASAEAIGVLLALLSEDGQLADAAEGALASAEGEAVDVALTAAAAKAEGDSKARLDRIRKARSARG